MTSRVVRTADILDGYVSLDLECLDRIYLNGYVPNLQVGGQVVQFLALHGFPIPSPVMVGRIGDQFRCSVRSFADANQIPMIKFGKGDRKIEKMKPHLARQERSGLSGTKTSGRRVSRSAPTFRIRSRSGSTAMNGPNGRPRSPASAGLRWRTVSPPARTRPGCRPSATGSARSRSRDSSTAGWSGYRCR